MNVENSTISDACNTWRTRKNIEKINQWLDELDDEIDIAVLPEMWNTSYRLNELTELADEDGQRILPFLEQKAKEIHKHIVLWFNCI